MFNLVTNINLPKILQLQIGSTLYPFLLIKFIGLLHYFQLPFMLKLFFTSLLGFLSLFILTGLFFLPPQYTRENDAWVRDGVEVQKRNPYYHGKIVEDFYTNNIIHGSIEDMPEDDPGPFLPTWQVRKKRLDIMVLLMRNFY